MNWHRQFGLLLTDFFKGSPYEVELEKDLSLQQQFLDVVLVHKQPGEFAERLPDGFDNLRTHNLITFKSHHESLDDWALKELTGHYVNYRKQATSRREAMLPASEFGLYAVCSRYPHNLAQSVPWEQIQDGVYHCRRGTDTIVVVVVSRLPREEQNSLLQFFSASAELVAYARQHYRLRSKETSTVLNRLFQGYRAEGLVMPYTMADFRKEITKEKFKEMTADERQEVLESLSAEELEELERLLQQVKAASRPGKQKSPRKRK